MKTNSLSKTTTLLIYTFDTFPFRFEIRKFSPFIFKRLKSDLIRFQRLIEYTNPKHIIGVANSNDDKSRFETKAVNIFNRTKKVYRKGIYSYRLDFPSSGFKTISINTSYTDSFCNWTMYKISQIINKKHTRLQFIHITKRDIEILLDYLRKKRHTLERNY